MSDYAIYAPAKVNLYLHVGPVRDDGRHPLDSLVVFADSRAADHLLFSPSSSPLAFSVAGPFASPELSTPETNLVVKAVRLLEQASDTKMGGRLRLEKRLPVAAGIGGGSMDAAATLIMMNNVFGLGLSRQELAELSIPLGGDVPACVSGVPVLMRGDGDQVTPYNGDLPELYALFVRPDLACPTGPVFRAFDSIRDAKVFEEMKPPSGRTAKEFCETLARDFRNDLEDPAISIEAEISEVLTVLKDLPDTQFVAMSGSGATCFALFESLPACIRAEEIMTASYSRYWIKSTQLGMAGFDPDGFSL